MPKTMTPTTPIQSPQSFYWFGECFQILPEVPKWRTLLIPTLQPQKSFAEEVDQEEKGRSKNHQHSRKKVIAHDGVIKVSRHGASLSSSAQAFALSTIHPLATEPVGPLLSFPSLILYVVLQLFPSGSVLCTNCKQRASAVHAARQFPNESAANASMSFAGPVWMISSFEGVDIGAMSGLRMTVLSSL